jgi:hypothetical protein
MAHLERQRIIHPPPLMGAPHARTLPRSLKFAMIVGLLVARSVNAMVYLGRPHSLRLQRRMAALNVLLKRSLLSPAPTALPRVNLLVIVMAPSEPRITLLQLNPMEAINVLVQHLPLNHVLIVG